MSLSFVTKAKPNTPETVEQLLHDDQTSQCYKYDGTQLTTCEESDPLCLAKLTQYEDGVKRYTKRFLKISSRGQLYNPWGPETEGSISRFENQRGRKYWEFQEVSEDIYVRYLRFLETRNESHLLIAERQFKDNV